MKSVLLKQDFSHSPDGFTVMDYIGDMEYELPDKVADRLVELDVAVIVVTEESEPEPEPAPVKKKPTRKKVSEE